MITPLFTVSQSPDTVTVKIRVPFSRPRDFTISTDGPSFHFHCGAYLLHLSFPHALRPTTDPDPSYPPSSASYEFDSGVATVTLVKDSPGQHFPRLDCLSALLVSRAPTHGLVPRKPAAAGIEVVGETFAEDEVKAEESLREGHGKAVALEATRSSLLSSLSSLAISSPSPSSSKRSLVCEIQSPSSSSPSVSQERPVPPLSSAQTKTIPTPVLAQSSSHPASTPEIHLPTTAITYGFADRYTGVFASLAEDAREILQLPTPDTTAPHLRPSLRLASERTLFDPDHYLADHVDPPTFITTWSPSASPPSSLPLALQDALIKLPARSYLPDIHTTACYDLAAITFAACYDLRATCGERSVESAWAISRIAPSLAWLDSSPSAEAALRTAYARSLVFPLYRSRAFADAVLADVRTLFRGGDSTDVDALRARLLRLLVEVRGVFEDSLVLRIFSDIVFTDYCIWIQTVPDAVLEVLAADMAAAEVPTACLPWDLKRLERFAEQVESGQEPDDEEAVWMWDGKGDLGQEQFDVRKVISQTLPECLSVEKVEVAESAEVLISASGPRRAGSGDDLEEFGIMSVATTFSGQGGVAKEAGQTGCSSSESSGSSDL